jgi:TolA-binding protein
MKSFYFLSAGALNLRSLLLLMACWLGDCHSAQAADAILGNWQWSNGALLIFKADGSFTGKSAQGAVSGKWKPLDPAQRQYKLLWRINNEVKGVDTVTLASDGQRLSGQNAEGTTVGGKRTAKIPGDFVAAKPRPGKKAVPKTRPVSSSGTSSTQTSTRATRATGSGATTGTFTKPGVTRTIPTVATGDEDDDDTGDRPTTGGPALNLTLKLAKKNGKIVIDSVEGNALATILQLQAGDEVLTINGKTTAGMSAAQADRLINKVSDSVTLGILRQGDNARINVTWPHIRGTAMNLDSREKEDTNGGFAPTDDDNTATAGSNKTSSKVTRPLPPRDVTSEADIHAEKGAQLAAANNWSGAEAEFRDAIRSEPQNSNLWILLGEACMKQGKLDLAVAAFGRSVNLSPDKPGGHVKLAEALDALGRHDEARKEKAEADRLSEKN